MSDFRLGAISEARIENYGELFVDVPMLQSWSSR